LTLSEDKTLPGETSGPEEKLVRNDPSIAESLNGKWRAKAQRTRHEIKAGSQRYAGRCA
jgi:hypothetical protein